MNGINNGACGAATATTTSALHEMASAPMDTLHTKAREIVDAATAKSTIGTDAEDNDTVPRFDIAEVTVGRVVGRGGFCIVREVAELRLLRNESACVAESPSCTTVGTRTSTPSPSIAASTTSTKDAKQGRATGRRRWRWSSADPRNHSIPRDNSGTDLTSRQYMAQRIRRHGEKYVIKQVNAALERTDKVSFVKAIIDITLERKLLASLQHQNVIELRAQSISCDTCHDAFLILDYLPVTLPKRLNSWMHVDRSNRGLTGLFLKSRQRVRDLWIERLRVVYDIATVGAYLHQQSIVFRDFKPDNIGFNARGVTKLFDFGLAKELTHEAVNDDGLYLLTGVTGGIRYMAPEVARSQPYNEKVDIYSWSMILWYIMALEPPLGLYPPHVFVDLVVVKGYRPPLHESWSPILVRLLEQSWSQDIWERPSFQHIQNDLIRVLRAFDPEMQLTVSKDGDELV